ncbi:hypothetical protein IC619_000220 [Hazenella sp. IB182353]|nr:hypothetical protein [Polycladospora coralii]
MIKIGDEVLAKDEKTGEQAYKEVEWLYEREVNETYQVHVGGEIIETTDEHPFWVIDVGWVKTIDLRAGDVFETADGKTLTVDQIVKQDKKAAVYNFKVKDFHTYYVSDLKVFTHNECGTLKDSRTINFSQNTIGERFDGGGSLNGLVARMRYDPSYASSVPPISTVKYRDLPNDVRSKLSAQGVGEQTVFSLDNRRPYAARMAKVKVNARWATVEEIAEFAHVRRFSTANGGGLPHVK